MIARIITKQYDHSNTFPHNQMQSHTFTHYRTSMMRLYIIPGNSVSDKNVGSWWASNRQASRMPEGTDITIV